MSLSPRLKMRLDSDLGPASSADEPAPWTLHPRTARRVDDARWRNIQAGRQAGRPTQQRARTLELQARSSFFLRGLFIQVCHLATKKRNVTVGCECWESVFKHSVVGLNRIYSTVCYFFYLILDLSIIYYTPTSICSTCAAVNVDCIAFHSILYLLWIGILSPMEQFWNYIALIYL